MHNEKENWESPNSLHLEQNFRIVSDRNTGPFKLYVSHRTPTKEIETDRQGGGDLSVSWYSLKVLLKLSSRSMSEVQGEIAKVWQESCWSRRAFSSLWQEACEETVEHSLEVNTFGKNTFGHWGRMRFNLVCLSRYKSTSSDSKAAPWLRRPLDVGTLQILLWQSHIRILWEKNLRSIMVCFMDQSAGNQRRWFFFYNF